MASPDEDIHAEESALAGSWRIPTLVHPELYGLPPVDLPRMLSFGIERDHPLVSSWPPLRDEILGLLKDSPIKWSALEVLRRRTTVEPSRREDTTIVVTGKKVNNQDWLALESAIRTSCASHGQATLRVELVDGAVSRLGSSEPLDYSKNPAGGTSIGVTGRKTDCGTFGGYIVLKDSKGHRTVCGLTCHHVIDPYAREAIKTPEPTMKLSQPSEKDVEAAKKSCREMLNDLAQQSDKIKKEKEAFDEIGRPTGKLDQVLKKLEESEECFKHEYEAWSHHDLHFGEVLQTSGLRVAPEGNAIDWGLIVVSQSRTGKNTFPHIPTRLARSLGGVSAGSTIEETAELELGDDVLMFGKVSGAVKGMLSAIEAEMTWEDMDGIQTRECLLTGVNGYMANRGDSGAWILDFRGRLVGMLMAGRLDGARGYMTPIGVLSADIELETGCSIELPASE